MAIFKYRLRFLFLVLCKCNDISLKVETTTHVAPFMLEFATKSAKIEINSK